MSIGFIFGNLHHMTFMVLDMSDSVDFLGFYGLIGKGRLLHILALRCIHTFLNNTISWLFYSITLLTNLL